MAQGRATLRDHQRYERVPSHGQCYRPEQRIRRTLQPWWIVVKSNDSPSRRQGPVDLHQDSPFPTPPGCGIIPPHGAAFHLKRKTGRIL